jgi:hypothetical protein
MSLQDVTYNHVSGQILQCQCIGKFFLLQENFGARTEEKILILPIKTMPRMRYYRFILMILQVFIRKQEIELARIT